MLKNYHRHDISDEVLVLLELLFQGGEHGASGACDNRTFIDAVCQILRIGAPWHDLSPKYGSWNNINRRFCRWRDKGVWERILEALMDDPDYEWLMIDTSHIKVHLYASGN